MTLRDYVDELTKGTVVSQADGPPWWEEGVIVEVDEETYENYLDMLPPVWLDGCSFCFAEGPAPFLLFWKRCGHYFARQLSADETARFSELAWVCS